MATKTLNLFKKPIVWNEIGARAISGYAMILGIPCSFQEINDFIINREFLDPNEDHGFEDEIVNMAKSWESLKELILETKYNIESKNVESTIEISQLLDVYTKLDPKKTYRDYFLGESDESKEFIQSINDVLKHLSIEESHESTLEYMATFFIEQCIKKPLGEFTDPFIFSLIEGLLIFKDVSPLVFIDEDEFFNEIYNQHTKTVEICSTIPQNRWIENTIFRQYVNLWINKSEYYLEINKENFDF